MNNGPLADDHAERIVPDSWEAWMQFRDALMTGERPGLYIADMPRLERAYVLLRDRGVFDSAFVAAMNASFQRFHQRSTRAPVNVAPQTIGSNLAEWTKAKSAQRHPPRMVTSHPKEKPTVVRMIEPADRVRSKGGEITYVHGIPGPGDENRRYTP